jgi:predicted O-linked N-acetylglucosamine transferase (SPINDLY family)
MTQAHLELGRAAFARGDFETAFAAAGLALATPSAEARVLRANAAVKLERWADAIPSLEQLCREFPQQPGFPRLLGTCWLRTGNSRRADGDLPGAAQAYAAALQADTGNDAAAYSLGTLYIATGRAAEAEALLRSLIERTPDDAAAQLEWSRAALSCGQEVQARSTLRNLAAHAAPNLAMAALSLLVEAGDFESAATLGMDFYASRAEHLDKAWELATALRLHGHLDHSDTLLDAIAPQADAATRLRFDLPRLLGLPMVYADTAQIELSRQRYAAGIGTLVERYPSERLAAIAPRPDLLVFENFLLAYQCRDDKSLQQAYGRWLGDAVQAAMPGVPALAKPPRRARQRLVIVSSCLRECTVGSYFFSWTAALVRAGFEVVAVQIGSRHDARTAAFAQAATQLVRINGELSHIATRLRELQADIALFPEIGMDGRVIALAALRVAPVQVCAWGHPVTTGLPAMDAFLSCVDMEPDGAQAHYSERLLLLPGLGTRYASPPPPPPAIRAELGLPENRPLYLVPQSPYKIHPDNDAVLMEVVRRDADACFVMFDGEKRGTSELLQARLRRRLSAVSARPEHHLRVLPRYERDRYLQVNRSCDVMLDNLHWSGGNTSLDALHMGLPVVTCPGEFMRGRQSAAMLRRLDCADLVADSPQKLAETAVNIAHSPDQRTLCARRIQAHLPELVNRGGALQVLGEHLRGLLT